MGVAGSFFELLTYNFGKLDIFYRCSNDISIVFGNSLWGQPYQKCPDHPKVHSQVYSGLNTAIIILEARFLLLFFHSFQLLMITGSSLLSKMKSLAKLNKDS